MEQLDQFIEYLFTVEENTTQLTQDQFIKLCAIQGKVNDIVNKIHHLPVKSAEQSTQVAKPVNQPQLQLQLAENRVHRFKEFQKHRQ
jgi:hypothetical protein